MLSNLREKSQGQRRQSRGPQPEHTQVYSMAAQDYIVSNNGREAGSLLQGSSLKEGIAI